MAGAMLSKSVIQFSVKWQDCVPFLLIDLRPNYGGGKEDNGDLLQKFPCLQCCTQCPQSCSRPVLTSTSTRDSWTLTGKSGPVFCGVTAPFSWVLVHTRFCLCPPRLCSPVLCELWRLYGVMGLMANSSKRAMSHPGLLHPETLSLRQATADLYLHRRHSNAVLAQSLWGLWVLVGTKFV